MICCLVCGVRPLGPGHGPIKVRGAPQPTCSRRRTVTKLSASSCKRLAPLLAIGPPIQGGGGFLWRASGPSRDTLETGTLMAVLLSTCACPAPALHIFSVPPRGDRPSQPKAGAGVVRSNQRLVSLGTSSHRTWQQRSVWNVRVALCDPAHAHGRTRRFSSSSSPLIARGVSRDRLRARPVLRGIDPHPCARRG